jgi:hypothetical protein
MMFSRQISIELFAVNEHSTLPALAEAFGRSRPTTSTAIETCDDAGSYWVAHLPLCVVPELAARTRAGRTPRQSRQTTKPETDRDEQTPRTAKRPERGAHSNAAPRDSCRTAIIPLDATRRSRLDGTAITAYVGAAGRSMGRQLRGNLHRHFAR